MMVGIIIIVILVVVITLFVLASIITIYNNKNSDALKFKDEYESLNGEVGSLVHPTSKNILNTNIATFINFFIFTFSYLIVTHVTLLFQQKNYQINGSFSLTTYTFYISIS